MASVVPKCSVVFAAAGNYSCIKPFPNCTNPNGFDLDVMRNITLAIASSCLSDPRLFQNTSMLTDRACREFANGNGWRRYKAKQVWGRVVSWKLPLFQLAALFQRPPLSACAEFFSIVHLMGDPISTLYSLLIKFERCQIQAVSWYNFQEGSRLLPLYDQASSLARIKEQPWREFAAISDAYGEFGQDISQQAVTLLKGRLTSGPPEDQEKFLQICLGTGNALAADRTTKFFPMVVAQVFLLFNIAISFVHAKGEAQKPDGNINIDALSIAFGALFFWIIPTVALSSIIGVSQSAHSLSRILLRFSERVKEPRLAPPILTPHQRILNGSMYSWQQLEHTSALSGPSQVLSWLRTKRWVNALTWRRILDLLVTAISHIGPGSTIFPVLVVTIGCLTGLITAYLVPPAGFECRHIGILSIFLTWVFSWLFGRVFLPPRSHPFHYYLTLVKDICCTLATLGGLALGQAGIYSRCSCYTLWGKTGLAIPGDPETLKTLADRIDKHYPGVVLAGIAFQLIVVMPLVYCKYRLAFQVFMRGDKGNDLPGEDEALQHVYRYSMSSRSHSDSE